MSPLVGGLVALLLATLLPAAASAASRVEVLRQGEVWTADFHLDRPERAWVLSRSSVAREDQKPWRPRSWTVETPGVRLVRLGSYDAFVTDGGLPLPRRIRIRFKPVADDLIADYDPALIFTDGTVALYDRHFHGFPMRSAAAVAGLPPDLAQVPQAHVPTRTRFRDGNGTVMHAGRSSPSVSLSGDTGTYILFGKPDKLATDTMVTVIDPKLPAWLRASLAKGTPAVLAHYARRLGPAAGSRPTFLISWAGPTPGLVSMGGSVLPSLVTMRFEGAGLLAPNPRAQDGARWFIAHEAAHFWLGEAVTYEFNRDAWITEGGADLLAIRTVAALEPSYDARAVLQASADDCLRLTKGKSVESAEQRNEHRSYYACGALFGLVAEAAQRKATGGDFHDFVRGLIEANRADRLVTRTEWLAALSRLAGSADQSAAIRQLLEVGSADPLAAYAALFTRAGIAHRTENGRLILL